MCHVNAGLDPHDAALSAEIRAAYEEWLDNQLGPAPDPALHSAWIDYVLGTVLDYSYADDLLLKGQAIPQTLIVQRLSQPTVRPDRVLVGDDAPHLLITVYPLTVDLDKRQTDDASPISNLIDLLRGTGHPLGLVTNGEQWTLVHALPNETTGIISWYANLWLEEPLTLRAFRTLLGLERFFNVPDDAMLKESSSDQHDVTDQLGYQVRNVVEILVQKIATIDQNQHGELLRAVDEGTLYEAALVVMMRLVFLLSAEARGLLLLGDPIYDQHYAVSTLRGQLREAADHVGEEVIQRRSDAWARLLATFRAVHGGIWHEDLRLPAYGGSLFDPDRFPFLEGRQVVSRQSSVVT